MKNKNASTDLLNIGVRIDSLDDLLEPYSPEAMPNRRLNSSMDDYLLSQVTDHLKQPVKITIYTGDKDILGIDLRLVRENIKNYFEERMIAAHTRYNRNSWKLLRKFLYAFCFLAVCLYLSNIWVNAKEDILQTISQSLVIIGWVAIWDPAELLLYDRQDTRNNITALRNLSVAEVDILELKEEALH